MKIEKCKPHHEIYRHFFSKVLLRAMYSIQQSKVCPFQQHHSQKNRSYSRCMNCSNSSKKKTILISRCLLGDNVVWHGKNTSNKINLFSNKKKKYFLQNVLSFPETRMKWFPPEEFQFIPYCPEVDGLELSVPRPPIKITQPKQQRLDNSNSNHLYQLSLSGGADEKILDATTKWTQHELDRIFEERFVVCAENHDQSRCNTRISIDAFISKSKSPMCGLGDVKVFNSDRSSTSHDDDHVSEKVDGGFMTWIKRKFPNVLITTEKELNSEEALKKFIAECSK